MARREGSADAPPLHGRGAAGAVRAKGKRRAGRAGSEGEGYRAGEAAYPGRGAWLVPFRLLPLAGSVALRDAWQHPWQGGAGGGNSPSNGR